MIKTIIIDVINDKAMKLLRDLELLHLIRMRKENKKPLAVSRVMQYKGAMSKQPIADVDNQLNELRSGWE